MDYLNAETREIRDRLDDIERSILARDRPSPSAPRYVGQVYKGPNYVASVPKFFLTHPVTSIVGDETEGIVPTVNVDMTRTVVVAVFGHVPAAGDVLYCYSTPEGYWYADVGVPATSGGGGGGGGNCKGCTLTTRPINYSIVYYAPSVTLTGTVTYDPVNGWTSPVAEIPGAGGIWYKIFGACGFTICTYIGSPDGVRGTYCDPVICIGSVASVSCNPYVYSFSNANVQPYGYCYSGPISGVFTQT